MMVLPVMIVMTMVSTDENADGEGDGYDGGKQDAMSYFHDCLNLTFGLPRPSLP